MFVSEISNQCLPLPCHTSGYERCVDGRGFFTCVCRAGWRGQRCEEGEMRSSEHRRRRERALISIQDCLISFM